MGTSRARRRSCGPSSQQPAPLAAASLALLLLASAHPGAAAPLRNPDGSCMMFPPGSPWKQDISQWPVYSQSRAVVATIGTTTGFHADFSGGEDRGGKPMYYGIPLNEVDTNPAKRAAFPGNGNVVFEVPDESDRVRYPFPVNAKVEGAWLSPGCDPNVCDGDRHVIVRDNYTCLLFEAYYCTAPSSMAGSWRCYSGAVFNLSSPKLPQRHAGWTSADAAGLPMWPGLVTVSELLDKGVIDHALRFTAPDIRPAYQFPATHLITVSAPPSAPWMGMRARLRASFSCGLLKTPAARVVCAALKKTGMILADRGSSWYLTGEATPAWEARFNALGPNYWDNFLNDFKAIKGSDVEVVVPPTGACLCDRTHAYNCDTTTCLL